MLASTVKDEPLQHIHRTAEREVSILSALWWASVGDPKYPQEEKLDV